MTRVYNRSFRAEDARGNPIAGAQVTLWTAKSGGTQIVDGITDLDGAPIPGGILVCDTWGYTPDFQDTTDRPGIWAIGSLTGAITNVERVLLESSSDDTRLTSLETYTQGAGGLNDRLTVVESAIASGGGGGGGGGGPALASTVMTETAYGINSAAGSALTAARGDHTHGTPSLASTAPTSSAPGDAAGVGTGSAPARSDHVHAREPYGTPGSSAVGDAAAAGSANAVARADHTHGRESFGVVTAQTAFGATSTSGTATTPARSDHTHGTPPAPTATSVGAEPAGAVSTHASASDPHGDRAFATSAANSAAATRVPSDSTITAVPSAPLVVHRRNFAVDSSTPNVNETWVNGAMTAWHNEWGGLRGQPLYAWDAVVRAVAHPSQSGNIIEYQNNARTQTLWGVNASGRVVQGNGSAAPVVMAPVYVAPASASLPADLPAGLPAGTVVIQQTS